MADRNESKEELEALIDSMPGKSCHNKGLSVDAKLMASTLKVLRRMRFLYEGDDELEYKNDIEKLLWVLGEEK